MALARRQGGFACTGQAGGPPGGGRALAGHEDKDGLQTAPWCWCMAPQVPRAVALTREEVHMAFYSFFDSY